jgi:hypothetical protein
MASLIDKAKQLVIKMNEYGIPLPILRINGIPTFTGTMVFLSFNTALLGQLGKISKFFGDVDLTQANYLLGITLAAYLGRRIQSNGTTKTLDMAAPAAKEE